MVVSDSYKADMLTEIDPWALAKAAGLANVERTRCHFADGSHVVVVVDVQAKDAHSLISAYQHPITRERLSPDDLRAHGRFAPLLFSRGFLQLHSPEFANVLDVPPPAGEFRAYFVTPVRDFLFNVAFQ